MALRHVTWRRAWRIIASRYPPIDLFERVSADPAVWEALIALEQLTNPRVRDQVGEIALVAPEDRVSGQGASYVMGSFTHLNVRGSRFSDGTFGVYYCAAELQTAIAETIFHFEEFARDSSDPERSEDMRVLVGTLNNNFEDVREHPEDLRREILRPDSYQASQRFAASIRENGGLGIVYPSVRNAGGECCAAFRPTAVGVPIQERHLKYRWNGERVDRYFDYLEDRWIEVPESR